MTTHRSRWNKRILTLLGAATIAVLLTSCFATQAAVTGGQSPVAVPGFWKGFWQGFIAPIAFVVSLFSDHVRIYAVPNTGRLYDFGFMLGIGGFSGGIFKGSRRRRVKRKQQVYVDE